MKISASSLALLLASPIISVSSMTTLPGGSRHLQAFTSPFVRGGGARLLQDGDGEDTPDEEPSVEEPSMDDGDVELPMSRSCVTESGTSSVTHECKAETSEGDKGSEMEIEDEIDFEVSSSDDGICIEVKYEQEIEDEAADMEQETEASFKVCFQQLIEYSKADGSTDQAYGWVEGDTIHQSFDLTNWQDFGEVLTDSNDGMSTFDVTSNDDLITMTFTIKPAGDDQQITANSMKADVRIVNFPWTEGEDSYVALLSVVESELEVDIDQDEDDELDEVLESGEEPIEEDPVEDGGMRRFLDSKAIKPKDVKVPFSDVVNTIGFSPLGKVTWAETAVAATAANDTDVVAVGRAEKIIQVVATSPPEGSERRRLQDGSSREQIAFSFIGDGAQGSPDIFWDPEAGVDYMRTSNSGVGTLVSTCGVVGGLISALLLMTY